MLPLRPPEQSAAASPPPSATSAHRSVLLPAAGASPAGKLPVQQCFAAQTVRGVCQGPRDSSEAAALLAELRGRRAACAAPDVCAAATTGERQPSTGVAASVCESAPCGDAAAAAGLCVHGDPAAALTAHPGGLCSCVAMRGVEECEDAGDCSRVGAGEHALLPPSLPPQVRPVLPPCCCWRTLLP